MAPFREAGSQSSLSSLVPVAPAGASPGRWSLSPASSELGQEILSSRQQWR
eukprot:CAMPEP_0115129466 /NCGR_PEP_ID=MMETSP0227-20121206/51807_1 /TAXON_ID=89957 /ORGANISM="Polarella glacialis, Strain CCMP 1383" /LENGTH=50 /DNA_ID=CAMNT_0002534339 /DNA_START=157 /DNA_END=305 /DNA_ORIENTATION=+